MKMKPLNLKSLAPILFAVVSIVSGGPLDFAEICGTRPALAPQTRIFNGRDALQGAWPWVGLIISNRCMAVLIDEWWAVTIPFCRRQNLQNGPRRMHVVFGDTSINGSSPFRQEVVIRREYTHPNSSGRWNSLLLLHFESPVNITDYVRPACLSQSENESEDYEACWVAGWGNNGPTGVGESAPVLQEGGTINVYPDFICQLFIPTIYHETILCQQFGFDGEPRGCLGDNAAPIMCLNGKGRWELIAQQNGLAGLCGGNLVLNSRISKFYNFILEHIKRVEECMEPDLRCDDNVTCVLEEEQCDAEVQCPTGEDETDCPGPVCYESRCLNGGSCRDSLEGEYICRCTEGWEGRHCERATCGQTRISVRPGTTAILQSPLFPELYPGTIRCEYTVIAPEGYKVLVTPIVFQLTQGFDYLSMDNLTFTGKKITPNYTSIDDTLNIRFTSRFSVSDQGFQMNLSAIDVTGVNECEWTPCSFDGICTEEEDGFSCECVDERLGRRCVSADDYCNGPQNIYLDESTYVNLTSFHYYIGNEFQVPYTCAYKVTVPVGHHVHVHIRDAVSLFSLENILLLDNLVNHQLRWLHHYTTPDNDLDIIFHVGGADTHSGVFLTLLDFEYLDGDECLSQPCRNGGICDDQVNGFTCKCRRGFSGNTCEIQTDSKRCGRNKFGCNNGRCVPATSVCDGRNHCGDYSDEFACYCNHWIGFFCHNGRCLPERFVCDGDDNCGDATDELRPECKLP